MPNPAAAFPDPRVPDPRPPTAFAAGLHALAAAILDAPTAPTADAAGVALVEALRGALGSTPEAAEAAFQRAPTPEISRQVWRSACKACELAAAAEFDAVHLTAFAIPLVIVAGLERSPTPVVLPGLIADPGRLAAILAEDGALGGSTSVALSPVLAGAGALRLGNIAAWHGLRALSERDARLRSQVQSLFEPAPITVSPGPEGVHLRFLIGTAVASAGRDILAATRVGSWGSKLTQELVAALGQPGASVLALPRVPGHPLTAALDGASAQREVSAQLFATNAIRKLRAAVGEPTAVISSHRASDAPGGGELRLSLSSPFAPRDAEGFRCPIFPTEPVSVPLRMLTDLLEDCRVTDLRLLAGVHPDRVAGAGMPLFFKAETIPEGALLQ